MGEGGGTRTAVSSTLGGYDASTMERLQRQNPGPRPLIIRCQPTRTGRGTVAPYLDVEQQLVTEAGGPELSLEPGAGHRANCSARDERL